MEEEEAPGGSSGVSVHERYARVPGRSLESRYRYWSHRHLDRLYQFRLLGLVLITFGAGLLPGLAFLFATRWLESRSLRTFHLLGAGQAEKAETLALEEASRELPGPVQDEYWTAAAIARTMQGDLEGTREYLEKREGPVHELQALSPYLHRPLASTLLMAQGEPHLALEMLGEIDAAVAEAPLCLTHAGLLLTGARYQRAQEILLTCLDRFTAPDTVRDTHALLLRLARETWDPEIENLLRRFRPDGSWESEVQLASRLFLAEIQGRAPDAVQLSQKLMHLRCQQVDVEFSEDFLLWRDSLKSAQLHVRDTETPDLEAALERAALVRDRLDPRESQNIEGCFLEAWLEMSLALGQGRTAHALLEGEEDRVLLFSGGVLAASRILLRATVLDDLGAASEELMHWRGLFPELPALQAVTACLKILRGSELGEEDPFRIRRGLYARRLFPPEVERELTRLCGSGA